MITATVDAESRHEIVDERSIGERVRAVRESLGLTQQDLAERIGITVQAVSRLENGHIQSPQRFTLKGYAQALSVSVDYLRFGRESTPEEQTEQSVEEFARGSLARPEHQDFMLRTWRMLRALEEAEKGAGHSEGGSYTTQSGGNSR